VSVAETLLAENVVVADHFLSRSQVRALNACAEERWGRGEFAGARIGAPHRALRTPEIRGDYTCWLADPLMPAESALMDALEQLRLELNRGAYLGLFELELHYARYPPGTGYQRHIDHPIGRSQRVVSLVLYLNEDWRPASGGELRLFGAADSHWDVEPLAGRLLMFLTEGREHAVLATRRDRLGISGWFKSRN